MLSNKQALIPYLLLIAALAGGLLWHESELVPGLGKSVITGQATVGGPFRLTDQTRSYELFMRALAVAATLGRSGGGPYIDHHVQSVPPLCRFHVAGNLRGELRDNFQVV